MTSPQLVPPQQATPGSPDPVSEFASRMAGLVARADRARDEECRACEAEMAQRLRLQAAFDRLADQLHRQEIRPRLETVAALFDNARIEHRQTADGVESVCTFTRTARFPAASTLSLGVRFDFASLGASVWYRLQIVPMLMEFEGQDALPIQLDAPGADEVPGWVEAHLERFVETYLALERDPRYRRSVEHVDPVCGMRVTEATAITAQHGRQTYYFCAPMCRDRFETDPLVYVDHAAVPVRG